MLGVQLPWIKQIDRRQLPVVPSAQEVASVPALLEGGHRLLAQVLQGTGLRG